MLLIPAVSAIYVCCSALGYTESQDQYNAYVKVLTKLNKIAVSEKLTRYDVRRKPDEEEIYQYVLDCLVEILIRCTGSQSRLAEILQDTRKLAEHMDNLRKEEKKITFLTTVAFDYYEIKKSFLEYLISDHPRRVTCSRMELSTPELILILVSCLSGRRHYLSLL